MLKRGPSKYYLVEYVPNPLEYVPNPLEYVPSLLEYVPSLLEYRLMFLAVFMMDESHLIYLR